MKHLIKSILAIFMIAFTITSCDKAQDLAVASNGNAPTLSSSASFTPTAADSSTGKLTINWTDPKYANDPTTTRYELQIDSTGRNFARAAKRVVIGKHKYV
jgi:starch-binding outer membrane protein SusE/F